MIVTVDTGELFQKLSCSIGASNKILNLFNEGKIQLASSVLVFIEYCEVL